VTDLVQTCPNTNSAKSCVEHPTSKIHTGLNTGPKLGKLMLKRPEFRYKTIPKRINVIRVMSRDYLLI
jgi:hypothetical protein